MVHFYYWLKAFYERKPYINIMPTVFSMCLCHDAQQFCWIQALNYFHMWVRMLKTHAKICFPAWGIHWRVTEGLHWCSFIWTIVNTTRTKYTLKCKGLEAYWRVTVFVLVAWNMTNAFFENKSISWIFWVKVWVENITPSF